MIATAVLIAYAALLSAAYLWDRYRVGKPRSKKLDRVLAQASKLDDPVKSLELLKALAELEQASLPWYQRSLSAIGVIAFLSMTLAAGLQTVNSYLEQAKAQRLEGQIEALRTERQAAEQFVDSISATILADLERGGRAPGKLERRLLAHRLRRIEQVLDPTPEQLREAFSLAVALQDWAAVASAVEHHKELLDLNALPDLLSLAEYYFIVGSRERAREVQGDIWPQRTRLAVGAQRRLLMLRAALGFDREAVVAELARLFDLRPEEARAQLEQAVGGLQRGKANLLGEAQDEPADPSR